MGSIDSIGIHTQIVFRYVGLAFVFRARSSGNFITSPSVSLLFYNSYDQNVNN